MPVGTYRMLARAITAGLPPFILWGLVRGLYLLLRRRRGLQPPVREALLWAFILYLSVLVQITTVRGGAGDRWLAELPLRLTRVNFVPLIGLYRLIRYGSAGDAAYNIIGNLLWFFPAGILLPVIWPKMRRFCRTLAFGASLSLVIELFQLLLGTGITDVDDIILNAAGAAAGYGMFILLQRIFYRKKRQV